MDVASYEYMLFQTKKKITHNFFAAYHGHSLADAHAAKGKQAIKYEYIHSQQTRMKNINKNTYWGPRSSPPPIQPFVLGLRLYEL